METKMPISVDDAVLGKIRDLGGEIVVMRGERFEKNLAAVIALDGVNNREVHESVRRLVRSGQLVQFKIVDREELPMGVQSEGSVKQYIFRIR